MQTTQKSGARLAACPIRSTVANGYRAPALMARLSTSRARHDAAERLCAKADRKPSWLYEARSKGRALPCERLDAAITEGIAEGYITAEVLADYFGELFALYRAMMPDAHATYLDTVREKAEAMEAVSAARGNPTPETCAHAARELLEDAIVTTAHAKRLLSGSAA